MPGTLLDTSAVLAGPADLPATGAISVITLGELRAGVALAQTAETAAHRLAGLEAVRATFVPLPVDEEVARSFGDLLALARREGRITKATDLLIVATAQATGRALLTLDERQGRLAEAAGVPRA